ncbi:MAG: DUF3237 family protein [Rhizobiaceae bacterium]|nr:DUF3237 family protein [Rhizobiaceae bacterium]
MNLNPPQLELVCDYSVDLAPVRELGSGLAGKRRIVPIVGGIVEGPKIQGRILNIGADWQTVFDNGVAKLDTRYAIETTDGAIIEVINFGYRHGPDEVIAKLAAGEVVPPEAHYMRTAARLETGDQRYDWVNRMIFVGTGARLRSQVRMSLFCVK